MRRKLTAILSLTLTISSLVGCDITEKQTEEVEEVPMEAFINMPSTIDEAKDIITETLTEQDYSSINMKMEAKMGDYDSFWKFTGTASTDLSEFNPTASYIYKKGGDITSVITIGSDEIIGDEDTESSDVSIENLIPTEKPVVYTLTDSTENGYYIKGSAGEEERDLDSFINDKEDKNDAYIEEKEITFVSSDENSYTFNDGTVDFTIDKLSMPYWFISLAENIANAYNNTTDYSDIINTLSPYFTMDGIGYMNNQKVYVLKTLITPDILSAVNTKFNLNLNVPSNFDGVAIEIYVSEDNIPLGVYINLSSYQMALTNKTENNVGYIMLEIEPVK